MMATEGSSNQQQATSSKQKTTPRALPCSPAQSTHSDDSDTRDGDEGRGMHGNDGEGPVVEPRLPRSVEDKLQDLKAQCMPRSVQDKLQDLRAQCHEDTDTVGRGRKRSQGGTSSRIEGKLRVQGDVRITGKFTASSGLRLRFTEDGCCNPRLGELGLGFTEDGCSKGLTEPGV